MTEILIRITAPHYCAGLVARDGRVIEAAPILRWTVGKKAEAVIEYAVRKKYHVKVLP